MSDIFRDNLFAGRVVFITGGGSGIGLRIAERFAALGARAGIMGRRRETLEQAVAAVRNNGACAEAFPADVRDYAAVESAFRQARETLGPIDFLVCGAAGNFPAPALGMSANGFKSVVDIDLLGTYNACRAAYEHLRRPGAAIVNISATHAFRPVPLQAHVCAAKAGVDMLTKTLALEWGPAGVRVNSVAPGPVEDTEGMRRLTPTENARKALTEGIPLRRYTTKDEIADMVLFLCSDAAANITGTVCVCDGGLSLAGPRFSSPPGAGSE